MSETQEILKELRERITEIYRRVKDEDDVLTQQEIRTIDLAAQEIHDMQRNNRG
jgi:hypothetical protein